jgi:hypothetical protein
VKLYARTPGGEGLGLDVLLTGQVTERDDKLHRVQVFMPIGCASIVGYSIKPEPKGRGGTEVLWVDPTDLRANDGATVNQEAIRAEVERVKESLRYEALHGPLGENWP